MYIDIILVDYLFLNIFSNGFSYRKNWIEDFDAKYINWIEKFDIFDDNE